jgi:hypothetical protein
MNFYLYLFCAYKVCYIAKLRYSICRLVLSKNLFPQSTFIPMGK